MVFVGLLIGKRHYENWSYYRLSNITIHIQENSREAYFDCIIRNVHSFHISLCCIWKLPITMLISLNIWFLLSIFGDAYIGLDRHIWRGTSEVILAVYYDAFTLFLILHWLHYCFYCSQQCFSLGDNVWDLRVFINTMHYIYGVHST